MGKKKIQEIIARRTDLSTFLVHLTRTHKGITAKERLKNILENDRVKAESAFGMAREVLEKEKAALDSQKCVCFTETPLEYLNLIIGEIEDRQCNFAPYGIAITKKLGRQEGVNPVWYLDITPGHDWLTKPIDSLINSAVDNGTIEESDILKITPFIEQMGVGNKRFGSSYKKEFWWEREWRHVGDFLLPNNKIIICPEEEFEEFRSFIKEKIDWYQTYSLIDPSWGLEEIIARLAGFGKKDVELF